MKLGTFAFATALVVTMTSAPVWAASENGEQASAAQTQKDPGDEVVCRHLPPPTGSMIGGRSVCATKRQWEAQEKQGQDALRQGQAFRFNHGGGGTRGN